MSQTIDFPAFKQDYIEPGYRLPVKYGETFIVLMIRDPQNIFAYWEVAEHTLNSFTEEYGYNNLLTSKLAIRLSWANHQQIITVNDNTESWYIFLEEGIPLFGELGRILADNTFVSFAKSNYLNDHFVFNDLPDHRLADHLQKTLDKWQPGISS
ncbi:MAG: DUF4912 domain-containing protein [Peptococcaceae bacterium]